jgi:anti-sigma factor RsiW
MSAAREAAECTRLDCWLTAYVDVELDAAHCLEVEQHLAGCSTCVERVAALRATRVSLRRTCKLSASSSLRDRIGRSLELGRHGELPAEAPQLDQPAAAPAPLAPAAATPSARDLQLMKLRFLVPLAAAATFAIIFGALRLDRREPGLSADAYPTVRAALPVASLEGFLDDLVTQHATSPAPDTVDQSGLDRFDQVVGFHVRPPQFDEADVKWVGASLIHQRSRAAMMQYILRNRHRLTVSQFDSNRVPLRAERLQARSYGGIPVYVGHIRGYSVAASERDGVGYAIASDVSDDEAAKLVLMASR